jgi:V/A-type H+-transporting ATPase subunit C
LLNAYGLPYGSLKVTKTQFLKRVDYEEMLRLSTPADFISYLGDRGYGDDFSSSSANYQGIDLLEASNNNHLSRINKYSLSVTPQNGKDLIVSYLIKWDLHNIKTILISKNLNLKLDETEKHLISENNAPLGMFAGLLDRNDYRNILSMDGIEEIVSYLLKFGYGKVLLSYLDDYRKSNNLSTLLLSLDLYYYDMMKEKFRFYSGTEGPIFRLIKKTIDVKNIMTILKNIEYSSTDNISNYIISGGSLSQQTTDDLMKSGSVEEAVQKLKGYSDLSKGLDFYRRRGSLVGLEGQLNSNLYWEFISTLEMSSLSLNNIIAFLMRAEAEWKDIRNLVFSRYYGINEETIKMTTINLG